MDVGKTIKKYRKQKQLKQYELADLIGVSQDYISRVELGKKIPSMPMIEKISNTLGIPLPIFIFSSIDENDIKEEKRKRFKEIEPFIQSLIDTLYIDEDIIP